MSAPIPKETFNSPRREDGMLINGLLHDYDVGDVVVSKYEDAFHAVDCKGYLYKVISKEAVGFGTGSGWLVRVKPLDGGPEISSGGVCGAWFWPLAACSGSTSSVHKKAINDYPSECPRCKGPAYVGFKTVDCKRKCS